MSFKIASTPWCDWYHIMGSTFGTWLPGDPKGFRTRHHREHVEGDYKNPPPKGTHDARWKRSKELMYIRDHEASGATVWEWERARWAPDLADFDPNSLLID